MKAASVSSNVDSLEGTLTRRKTSKTVTVSVGAINAAKRKETYGERPTTFHKISPPTPVAIKTPTVAKANEGLITARRSLARR